MINIHREGLKTLSYTGLIGISLWILSLNLFESLSIYVLLLTFIFMTLFLQFFRNPKREIPVSDDQMVYAPADGKVVVIEEVLDSEFGEEKGKQISIFMSPFNVHVNRIPTSGEVTYLKYHPGKYLVAMSPKSSTDNERMTTIVESPKGKILLKQIAGAVARRIVNYLEKGQKVQQGQEMGFIKFGSRVDVILPIHAQVEVKMGEVVKGNKTVIAKF
jgi:phosphatidylserine decarboxylase